MPYQITERLSSSPMAYQVTQARLISLATPTALALSLSVKQSHLRAPFQAFTTQAPMAMTQRPATTGPVQPSLARATITNGLLAVRFGLLARCAALG